MMMRMLRNEEKELQIELTKLQIEHAHTMSTYTILLSIIFSMIFSAVSIYVPLGATTGNQLYPILAAIYVAGLALPVRWITNKMKETQEQLEKQIQELKKKYLW